MRGAWIVAAVLVVGGTAIGPACAGVYNTSEPWPLPRPFNLFRSDLAAYRAAASVAAGAENPARTPPPEGSLAEHYVRRVKELEALEARGTLSLANRNDLGAYYLRLGKYDAAVRVLEPKARDGDFLFLANLATAYELAGQGDLALRTREQALAAWPRAYPGWDTFQVNFYRKAEQYHQKLLTLRLNRPKQPRGDGQLQFDNLLPPFLGRSNYEVGGISPTRWSELPSDATTLVMQLLLWLPFDDGLHWLLGELLNASGDVVGAAAMMKAVVEKPPGAMQWNVKVPEELRQHYQAVAAAAAAREKYVDAVTALRDPYLNLKLLCVVTPRGMGLGAGDLMQEAAWPAIAILSEEQARAARDRARGGAGNRNEAAVDAESETSRATTPAPPGWMPDWKQVGVGFGAGVVVALLLSMQLRQMGRPKR